MKRWSHSGMLSYPNRDGASYKPKHFQKSLPSLPCSTIVTVVGDLSWVYSSFMWCWAAFLYS